MKVLIYTRMWNKSYFTKIAKTLSETVDIVYFSDFKNVGDIWTGEYIYNKNYDGDVFSNTELDEIITRCRFLNKIDRKKAIILSTRLYNGLYKLFKNEKFDIVLMPIIDCYTLDILSRIAGKNNVKIVSFVQNFIKGYSRFTLRGERCDLHRNVSIKETEEVLELLNNKDYKPSFSLNKKVNSMDILLRCLRNFLKNNIYYVYKKIKDRDFDNYHYNTIDSSNYITTMLSIKFVHFLNFSEIKNLSKDKTVYLPLHFTPEATVDYWCDDLIDVKYEKRIIDLLKESTKNICFIVKEHPAMVGRRSIQFYKSLNQLANVYLVHPYESSNQILESVDTVAVHTGSVGIEALLRGKRVLCLSKNYYSDLHPNAIYTKRIDENYLSLPILSYDSSLFISKLLDGLFVYKYVAGWNVETESDPISNISYWIKQYLNSIDQ